MLLFQSLASPCLPSLEAHSAKIPSLLFHDMNGREEDIPDSLVFVGIRNVPKKNNIKSETKIELHYYSHIKMEVLTHHVRKKMIMMVPGVIFDICNCQNSITFMETFKMTPIMTNLNVQGDGHRSL